MFCSKCGKENLEDANFCVFCGAPVNDFTLGLGRANVKENTVTPKIKNWELSAQAESCNTMMMVSLVFCCLNCIPLLNFLTSIPTFVLTIIAMNKAISFCSKYAFINTRAGDVKKSVRRMRYHYILSHVLIIGATAVYTFAMAKIDGSGIEYYKYQFWPAIFTLFLIGAACLYYVVALIVCFAYWIYIKIFFETAEIGLFEIRIE